MCTLWPWHPSAFYFTLFPAQRSGNHTGCILAYHDCHRFGIYAHSTQASYRHCSTVEHSGIARSGEIESSPVLSNSVKMRLCVYSTGDQASSSRGLGLFLGDAGDISGVVVASSCICSSHAGLPFPGSHASEISSLGDSEKRSSYLVSCWWDAAASSRSLSVAAPFKLFKVCGSGGRPSETDLVSIVLRDSPLFFCLSHLDFILGPGFHFLWL